MRLFSVMNYKNILDVDMITETWTSHPIPGYVFQYHVPPGFAPFFKKFSKTYISQIIKISKIFDHQEYENSAQLFQNQDSSIWKNNQHKFRSLRHQ